MIPVHGKAASLPPSIGAQSDLFLCMHLALESWFEPTVVAFGRVNRSHLFRHTCESRRIFSRIGPGPHLLGVGVSCETYEFSASYCRVDGLRSTQSRPL
eukprot:gene15837-33393_t